MFFAPYSWVFHLHWLQSVLLHLSCNSRTNFLTHLLWLTQVDKGFLHHTIYIVLKEELYTWNKYPDFSSHFCAYSTDHILYEWFIQWRNECEISKFGMNMRRNRLKIKLFIFQCCNCLQWENALIFIMSYTWNSGGQYTFNSLMRKYSLEKLNQQFPHFGSMLYFLLWIHLYFDDCKIFLQWKWMDLIGFSHKFMCICSFGIFKEWDSDSYCHKNDGATFISMLSISWYPPLSTFLLAGEFVFLAKWITWDGNIIFMRTYLGQVNMNKIFFKVAMSYEYSENHFTTYPNPKKLK